MQAAEAERLSAVDRARSALLAAVGHDLRTPIATAKAAVFGLTGADARLSSGERRELLATIESSTDRLAELVSNLLDMSRLQAGALSAQMQPVSLDAVVAQAVLNLGTANVEVTAPDDLPLARADSGLLERVVANLLDNAVRHGQERSKPVEVSAGIGGPARLLLRVTDHGPGVPVARWAELFDAFQTSGDRQPTGGLGLAIVHGLVEAMGGTVAPSHTAGGGLTMTVTLNAATPTGGEPR